MFDDVYYFLSFSKFLLTFRKLFNNTELLIIESLHYLLRNLEVWECRIFWYLPQTLPKLKFRKSFKRVKPGDFWATAAKKKVKLWKKVWKNCKMWKCENVWRNLVDFQKFGAVKKCVDLDDLVKSFQTSVYLMILANIAFDTAENGSLKVRQK